MINNESANNDITVEMINNESDKSYKSDKDGNGDNTKNVINVDKIYFDNKFYLHYLKNNNFHFSISNLF